MPNVTLSLLATKHDLLAPIISGEVGVEGVTLATTLSDPSEAFWRQLHFAEFDIAEMSLSSFLIAREKSDDMVAIPAFPSRRFMQLDFFRRTDAGIDGPESLAGKRIGVAEYQQTSSLWVRGMLEDDFGVSQYGLQWFMERSEELSHGGATGFQPPAGISLTRVPAGETLDSLLFSGKIDVAPAGRALRHEPNRIDKQTNISMTEWSTVAPLFPDSFAEGKRFVEKHGFVPANHIMVIRRDTHERFPWLAFNLYAALETARRLAQRRTRTAIPTYLIFRDEYLSIARSIGGDDPFPYGLPANRPMLETALRYSLNQGLIKKPVDAADLFPASVRG
jgi:4,5-dihydroxyphthalate decarboxylase